MPVRDITVQISCKIPTKVWNKIKFIAHQEETSATTVLLRALKREIKANAREKDLVDLGDRVCCTDWDGLEYTNFLIALVNDMFGIYTIDGLRGWRTLNSFKNVEKL